MLYPLSPTRHAPHAHRLTLVRLVRRTQLSMNYDRSRHLYLTLGSSIVSQAIIAYNLNESAESSASVNGASLVVSYVLAFVFPIFVPNMCAGLRHEWEKGVLALVILVLGLPKCWVLWAQDSRWRTVRKRKRRMMSIARSHCYLFMKSKTDES